MDSHLHEFTNNRLEGSVYQRESGTILPQHDGLGSFRVDQGGEDVQEHLYAFERFNPRRVKRRRESLVLQEGGGEIDSERAHEVERVRRIEKWRMEQSRVLVDEIQRETRRRKQSMSSERRSVVDQAQEDEATLSNVEVESESDRGFWNRITRRVIRDLIGIDDDLLSIIFGESLPEELSSTPTTDTLIPTTYDHSSWEYKLLERIARELGILANQISTSEQHPGAFSAYLRTEQIPLPYAGLPLEVIPETAPKTADEAPSSPVEPGFQPTLPAPIPIPASTSLAPYADATPTDRHTILTQEEWERDLDIKTIFRYLRAKFSSPSDDSPLSTFGRADLSTNGTGHLATASTADSAARAARVRQTHPLINGKVRPKAINKTWKVSVPAGGVTGGGIRLRRSSSSCATSERVAVGWGSGKGKRSASERHYWDWGNSSVEGGSLVGAAGGTGVGGWGEV